MKTSTIVLIGAGIAGYLFLSKSAEGEGTGGSLLDIPTFEGLMGNGESPLAPAVQNIPLVERIFPSFSNPVTVSASSYSPNTWAGSMNPVNPIGASREAVYNPFASILSIPNAGTAAPGSPYGIGVSPVSNPKKSSSGGGSSSSTYISSSSGTGKSAGSSGSFSSPSKKASVAAPSLSSYSGYSPTSWR